MEREKLEQAEQEGTFLEILVELYIQINNSFSVSMGSFFLELTLCEAEKKR